VTDGRGRVTGFNQQYLEIVGSAARGHGLGGHRQLLEVCGQQFEDPSGFLARVEEIYASSPLESSTCWSSPTAGCSSGFPRIQFVEERNEGRVWCFRDITERRLADDALQKQSERLRITLASIGDAVISTDAEGRVTFLNGVAESLTGWTQPKLLGDPCPKSSTSSTNGPPSRSRTLPSVHCGRGRRGLVNHTVLIARDGTRRPIDDSAAPIRNAAGLRWGQSWSSATSRAQARRTGAGAAGGHRRVFQDAIVKQDPRRY